jgi:hypothetical protein
MLTKMLSGQCSPAAQVWCIDTSLDRAGCGVAGPIGQAVVLLVLSRTRVVWSRRWVVRSTSLLCCMYESLRRKGWPC